MVVNTLLLIKNVCRTGKRPAIRKVTCYYHNSIYQFV